MPVILTTIHGTAPFVDHLPWRLAPIAGRETDTFSDGSAVKPYYPVGFTLDEMMQLSWRVKKWHVTGGVAMSGTMHVDVRDNINADTGEHYDYAEDSNAFSDLDTGVVEDEFILTEQSDLTAPIGEYKLTDFINPRLKTNASNQHAAVPFVYSRSHSGASSAHLVGDDTWVETSYADLPTGSPGFAVPAVETVEVHGAVNIFLAFLNKQPRIVPSLGTNQQVPWADVPQNQVYYDEATQLFYPYFLFSGECAMTMLRFPYSPTVPLGGGGFQFTTANDAWTPLGVFTVLGQEIPIYANPTSLSGSGTSFFIDYNWTESFNSVDFAMDPFVWWPFSNSEGQNVYDEDDGSELVDPFS